MLTHLFVMCLSLACSVVLIQKALGSKSEDLGQALMLTNAIRMPLDFVSFLICKLGLIIPALLASQVCCEDQILCISAL